MKKSYYVKALWDADAKVWYSESDVPGLVIEADTLGEFEKVMDELVPDLIEANTPTRSHLINGPALVFSASKRVNLRAA